MAEQSENLPAVKSVITDMAKRFGMERAAFEATIKATIMPANTTVSNEQLVAFLVVAKEYNLSPFTKEIFAFPGRNGGIQPIVSIDGWLKIINSHPEFDGMEFVDARGADGALESVTCRIHRKGRDHAIEVTEYMSECKRDTDTWKKWPARMLRHKATIQCARYAFGFSGIVDPDEADRIQEAQIIDHAPQRQLPAKPEGFESWVADMGAAAETGTEALTKAWEGSDAPLREYLTAAFPSEWENLKAKAVAVDNSPEE